MHSSRMGTALFNDHLYGCVSGGYVCVQGCVHRGCVSGRSACVQGLSRVNFPGCVCVLCVWGYVSSRCVHVSKGVYTPSQLHVGIQTHPTNCMLGSTSPPGHCGRTDTCRNITFPQLLLRAIVISGTKSLLFFF